MWLRGSTASWLGAWTWVSLGSSPNSSTPYPLLWLPYTRVRRTWPWATYSKHGRTHSTHTSLSLSTNTTQPLTQHPLSWPTRPVSREMLRRSCSDPGCRRQPPSRCHGSALSVLQTPEDTAWREQQQKHFGKRETHYPRLSRLPRSSHATGSRTGSSLPWSCGTSASWLPFLLQSGGGVGRGPVNELV